MNKLSAIYTNTFLIKLFKIPNDDNNSNEKMENFVNLTCNFNSKNVVIGKMVCAKRKIEK